MLGATREKLPQVFPVVQEAARPLPCDPPALRADEEAESPPSLPGAA